MSRMDLCLSMWSVQEVVAAGQMDLAGFLDYCVANGVDTVELLEFMQTESPAETRAMLGDRGIRIGAWSAANNFVQADQSAWQAQVDTIKGCIDQAAELGAPVMRVFSGDESAAIPYERSLSMILAGFRACEPYARQAGVVLAIENHGAFVGRSSQINRIVADVGSPFVRATLDTANFLFVDEDPLTAVQNSTASAAWVHAKDYRPCRSEDEGAWPSLSGAYFAGCALGDGCVDLPGIDRKSVV
jgi:sugar phosphate isomerase/epimerase